MNPLFNFACGFYALPTKLSLSQPTNFFTPTILISLPYPTVSEVSKCLCGA